jgi:nitrous oxide reductase accessory protein NosL
MTHHRIAPLRLLPAVLLLLAAAASALPAAAPPDPTPADRCPVCGMPVAPYPEWLGRVLYADGTALFFDGPKDLFRYLQEPTRFRPDRDGKDVEAVLVTAYYDGGTLPAEDALYVVGSDVLGPMGAELVPLRDRAEAEEFRRDHGGRRIVAYPQVTRELIAGLR